MSDYQVAFGAAGAGLGLLAGCLLGGPLGCVLGATAGATLGSQVGNVAYSIDHPEASATSAGAGSAANPIYEMQNAMYTIISLQLTMQMMQTMLSSLQSSSNRYSQITQLLYPIVLVSLISAI